MKRGAPELVTGFLQIPESFSHSIDDGYPISVRVANFLNGKDPSNDLLDEWDLLSNSEAKLCGGSWSIFIMYRESQVWGDAELRLTPGRIGTLRTEY